MIGKFVLVVLMAFFAQTPPDFYVEAMVDNPVPYEGQQMVYTFRYYAAVETDVIFTPPDFEGFWRGEQLTTKTAELVNGKQYIVTATSITLYPARDGLITVAPAALVIPETVFSDRPRLELTTQPVAVNVQPLPENAPAGFDGAVGRMEANVEIDKQTVTLGEPVNLRYTITGTGNLEFIFPPDLNLPDTWRSYPNPSTLTTQNRGALLVGEKVFEWRLIPDKAGSHEFPSIVFTYFDPQEAAYRSLSSTPFTMNVLPSASGLLELPDFEERSSAASALPLKPVSVSNSALFPGLGFWLLWLLPPLATLGVWGALKYRIYRERQQILSRQVNAVHQARRRLEKALKTKGEKAYIQIEEAIKGYFSDKLNQKITRSEVIHAVLQERAVEQEVSRQILTCLTLAEEGRYAPGGVIEPETLITQTAETLRTLDRVWS